jgi:hypothetical protein
MGGGWYRLEAVIFGELVELAALDAAVNRIGHRQPAPACGPCDHRFLRGCVAASVSSVEQPLMLGGPLDRLGPDDDDCAGRDGQHAQHTEHLPGDTERPPEP